MKLKEFLKKYRKAPYLWGGGLFAIAVLDCLDFLEYIIRAAISLVNNFPVKCIGTGVLLAVQNFVQSDYATLIMAYFWIIIADTVTKWLAISYKYLTENGAEAEKITTIDKFKGIVLAFDDRKITSRMMLWGFVGKYVLFGILVTIAFHGDCILERLGIMLPFPIIKFVLGYVVYNELLSICENLRDAGNGKLDKLVELMNTNVFSKLRK